MILRETKISECWCEKCHKGQMPAIHQILFDEKEKNLESLVGRKIKCNNCGFENTIEDILIVIPVEFLVSSQYEASKGKSNSDLNEWLNAPS